MSFQNKVVAITGGFGALGQAVANAAVAAGATVALIDRVGPDSGTVAPGVSLTHRRRAH